MTTQKCWRCPSASFCSCPPIETRPASVTAETVAALELRLAEAEKRLENLFKAHEVDRDHLQGQVTRAIESWAVAWNKLSQRMDAHHSRIWELEHDSQVFARLTALEATVSAPTTSRRSKSPRRPASSSSPARRRTKSRSGVPAPARPASGPRRRGGRLKKKAARTK